MIPKNKILNKLKTVDDPELRVNIVDLGLIYRIDVSKKNEVKILMTLTSPGCPLSYVFKDLIQDAILSIKGIKKVTVKLTFDPPWDPSKLSEEIKLQMGWNF
jgi:metal-sulfur cluster biosynthetic enzyme